MSRQIDVIALDEFGGLQALYCNLLTALRSRGIDVVTFNRARRRPARQILDREGLADQIESPAALPLAGSAWPPVVRGRRLLGQLNLFRRVRAEIRRSADPCVTLWNALPYAAYRRSGSRMILYDHGLSSIHEPTRAKCARLARLDKIVCVSRANEHLLRERWRYRGRIDVLPNPLRPDLSVETRAAPRRPSGQFPILGCASRLVPVKGIASLVHALRLLRDRGIEARLRIAGTGPELDLLTAAVRRLDAGSYVTFVGHVEEMGSFYDGIDLFVAPSLREPSGLSVLEAMAHGLPVILSNVDGHPEAMPYRDAAIFVEPTLPLPAYYGLGASPSGVPSVVYSPSAGAVVETKALRPSTLARAIERGLDGYGALSTAALEASRRIPTEFSFERYVDRYVALMR